MVPSTFARFQEYRRLRNIRRSPAPYFRDDDVISFIFDPVLSRARSTIQRYQQDITTYIDTLDLPLNIRGSISLHLTNTASTSGNVELGGAAQIEYNFTSRPDINLEAFLEAMEDRMYQGFDVQHIRVIVDIRLYDFVSATFRGGSDLERVFTNMPNSNYPLELTDFWGSSTKGLFQRYYQRCAPRHLKGVKGLLFYRWESEWWQVCAVMAIVYGVALHKLRLILKELWYDYKMGNVPFTGDHDFLMTLLDREHPNRMRIVRALDECHHLQRGEHLYNAAIEMISEVPVGICPTHYQLGEFFSIAYPTLTLVIVDESRHILYMRNSDEAPLMDPPALGFDNTHSRLTWDIIDKYMGQRIYVFYDHVMEHYLPIYSLERFMARSSVHMDVTTKFDPPVEVPTIRKATDRKMTACPFCDAGMEMTRIGQHSCKILRCRLCDEPFTNDADKRAHCNPHTKKVTPMCKRCKRSCFGVECLKKHQAICNGTVYIQCARCYSNIPSRTQHSHRCEAYECKNCDKKVYNPIEYNNRDHPDGYIVYHQCAMPGKDKMVKTLEREADPSSLANALFFTFDFECMLTKCTEYRDLTIHIHTVNCVSSAEISVNVGDDIEVQPQVWTQYDLDGFWAHIQVRSSAKKNFWIAHNFKGYDGRILFDYFQTKNIVPTNLLWQGGKLMQMQLAHPADRLRCIVFQDSLNHIATSLSKMPSMFGLSSDIARKGFFPYMFNIAEHQNYDGPIPPLEYFNVGDMHDRDKFMEWYTDRSRQSYNMKDEMTLYCENDALILSLSLSRYARICLGYSRVNPLPYLTIAQFTFMHYKMLYLPSNTIYYLDESFDTFARKAMHGGNTNVRRLFYECSVEEAGTLRSGSKGLRYIDVQSLYPTVQYYDAMPTGYPQSSFYFTESSQPSEEHLKNFFGFIECDIEPTRYMFHPLLGRFKNNKLYMDLHPHKRVVITSVEFQTAVSPRGGYKCTHVYRIDQYTPSYDLFRPFIRNWLRLKILSSSMPHADDPVKFEEYKAELKSRLDIKVERNDFKPNPSLRTLAKLVLNSLWGKFGQRSNLVECHILKTAKDNYEYHQLRRMGHIKEKSEASLGTTAYMKKCQRLNKWNKKNVALAAFVTAHARLRLWDYLEKLDARVVYHDTDSIIYERREADDIMMAEGDYLGQWESETGEYMIHSFVGLAPKTYAYKCMQKDRDGNLYEKTVVKSKGFSMKPSTHSLLSFDKYKAMVMAVRAKGLAMQAQAAPVESDDLQIKVPTTLFRHIPNMGMTFTNDDFKVLMFDYRKGFIDYDSWKTYPYGMQLFSDDPIFRWQVDGVLEEPNLGKDDQQCITDLIDIYNDADVEDNLD